MNCMCLHNTTQSKASQPASYYEEHTRRTTPSQPASYYEEHVCSHAILRRAKQVSQRHTMKSTCLHAILRRAKQASQRHTMKSTCVHMQYYAEQSKPASQHHTMKSICVHMQYYAEQSKSASVILWRAHTQNQASQRHTMKSTCVHMQYYAEHSKPASYYEEHMCSHAILRRAKQASQHHTMKSTCVHMQYYAEQSKPASIILWRARVFTCNTTQSKASQPASYYEEHVCSHAILRRAKQASQHHTMKSTCVHMQYYAEQSKPASVILPLRL